MSEFEKMNRVGEGTYGVVYRARDTKTGEIVALKRVRMDREKDGMPVSGLREVHVLLRCNHDNIVREVDISEVFLVLTTCITVAPKFLTLHFIWVAETSTLRPCK